MKERLSAKLYYPQGCAYLNITLLTIAKHRGIAVVNRRIWFDSS